MAGAEMSRIRHVVIIDGRTYWRDIGHAGVRFYYVRRGNGKSMILDARHEKRKAEVDAAIAKQYGEAAR
ncbi:hypothetical protein [Burkholderia stagnalis]|uniref:hypothetical protein n=1 Tax=Burkholderia stagnalis TaxID=1503054 RepID=UPI000F5EA3B4|nr:hypothetical protein [Burkholderia stagnalis]